MCLFVFLFFVLLIAQKAFFVFLLHACTHKLIQMCNTQANVDVLGKVCWNLPQGQRHVDFIISESTHSPKDIISIEYPIPYPVS